MNFDLTSMLVLTGIDVLMAIAFYLPMAGGVLSLLPIGAMAFGAYTFGFVLTHEGGLWAAYPLGIVAGAAVSAVGGFLALRLSGFAAAIATLGMAEIIQVFFMNFGPTGGAAGLGGIPLVTEAGPVLVALGVIVAGILRAELTRPGLVLRSIEADSLGAECVGINVKVTRLWLHVGSGAVAGLAGAFTAGYLTVVDPTQYGLAQANQFLVATVLGGSTTVLGSLVGGIVTMMVPEFIRFVQSYRLLFFSLMVIVVLLVRKEGLITWWMLARWHRPARPHPDSAGSSMPTRPGMPLEVRDISKSFGGIHVLRGVSLRAQPGNVLALIGANGAGKTTLLNVITATVRAERGEILLGDAPLHARAPHEAVRRGVVRTFQNLRLFSTLTAVQNVAVVDPSRAWELLELMGIAQYADVAAKTLPYGIQRRLDLARALAARPSVLLLDEPIAGMTRGEAAEIAAIVNRLRDTGITIVLIEHNLRFVTEVADHAVVLDRGRVIAEGAPADVCRDPQVIEAYLGTPGGTLPLQRSSTA